MVGGAGAGAVPAAGAALRTLLHETVDYAGLFPPAGLDMPAAVANYAAYRAGPDAWALGRFVLPAARLAELERAADPLLTPGDPWRLSALLGPDVAADADRVGDFDRRHRARRTAVVDAVELRAADDEAIARAAALVPVGATAYVELPLGGDVAPLVRAVARAGMRAKARTGGTTPDAFPPSEDLARFIEACIAADVAFKATAGLHHPLRGAYRLSYEPDAATGVMFGFLNVFLATALLEAGASRVEARALLEEGDPDALRIEHDAVAWRAHRLGARALAAARSRMVSFGSCSFREPVDEMGGLLSAEERR